jgi:hypothetical protein
MRRAKKFLLSAAVAVVVAVTVVAFLQAWVTCPPETGVE